MKERRIYDEVETKLAAVCNENGLLYSFSRDSYPLTLTVQPDSSLDGQLSMLEAGGRPGSRGPRGALDLRPDDGHQSRRPLGPCHGGCR